MSYAKIANFINEQIEQGLCDYIENFREEHRYSGTKPSWPWDRSNVIELWETFCYPRIHRRKEMNDDIKNGVADAIRNLLNGKPAFPPGLEPVNKDKIYQIFHEGPKRKKTR